MAVPIAIAAALHFFASLVQLLQAMSPWAPSFDFQSTSTVDGPPHRASSPRSWRREARPGGDREWAAPRGLAPREDHRGP